MKAGNLPEVGRSAAKCEPQQPLKGSGPPYYATSRKHVQVPRPRSYDDASAVQRRHKFQLCWITDFLCPRNKKGPAIRPVPFCLTAPARTETVHGHRSPRVTYPGNGDVVVVCSRSAGSRRPDVCGKSPKEIAFAVPMWARGYYSETPATGLEFCGLFRPRGRPPAFLVGASRPKPLKSDSVHSARSAA